MKKIILSAILATLGAVSFAQTAAPVAPATPSVSAPTVATPAPAGNGKTFAQNHPRRAQVLNRANHQESVANADLQKGAITKRQDRQINREDQRIKRQEQRDARKNGGYITKGEQKQLNKEENGVRNQLNKDVKKDNSK